jgi:DNA-directed RNA polymerase specialized sigma24 family protein
MENLVGFASRSVIGTFCNLSKQQVRRIFHMEQNQEYLVAAWNAYSRKLHAYIRKKIKSHEDSEDILADVFVKLAKQTEQSRIPHKLPHWLYLVTKNTIVDYYRRRRPLEELPQDFGSAQSTANIGPLRMYHAHYRRVAGDL